MRCREGRFMMRLGEGSRWWYCCSCRETKCSDPEVKTDTAARKLLEYLDRAVRLP